jgi:hypothetical protein
MKSKFVPLLVTLLVMVGLVVSFLAGAAVSRDRTVKAFSVEAYRMTVLNDIYFYSQFMRVLKESKSGNTSSAICHTQKATALLSKKIGECLADADCKQRVHANASLLAPELLNSSEAEVGSAESSEKRCG